MEIDKKTIDAIVEKAGEEIQAKWTALQVELKGEFITEEKFGELTADLLKDAVSPDDIKSLSESIEGLGLEIKSLQEVQKKNEKPMTLKQEIESQFDDMKKAWDEGKTKFTMDIKTNVTSASITDDSQGVYLPGFGQQAFKGFVLESLFSRVSLPANHHGTVYYVDQTTVTRNAANKDEAAAAPESALAWTQYSLGIGKILDSIPLTYEAMNDIAQLVPEVEMFLENNMKLHIQANLWDGNGTLPNWKGIYTYATDFTQALAVAGITAGTVLAVDDASLYDLIVQLATYISNGKESKYKPDTVIMNPVDINKMKLKKDANNNYILPPFISANGMVVDGIQVIECSEVTANTLALGMKGLVRYYDVQGISLEFGLDADDFTKDLVTLKARKRGNLLLRNVDATSWYKVTDIDTRIADITA
jgi:HK97 family phage major capsid protein